MNACRTSTLVRSLPPGLSSTLLTQTCISALPSHVPRRRRHHCTFVRPALSSASFKRSHSCMLCTATSSATPRTSAPSAEASRRPSRASLASASSGALAATAVASGLVACCAHSEQHARMEYQCASSDTVALSSSTVSTDDSLQHVRSHRQQCSSTRSLSLRSAVISIPHPDKKDKGGEDAFFAQCNALGVFDGVGGWASIGVDAGLYSKQLAQLTVDQICKHGSCSVREALKQAAAANQAIGSSTACVVGIDEHKLCGVNLGDSGLIVIRDGCIIYKTVEQQHYFNCPYQIGTDSLDTVDVANGIEVALRDGDWIIMGTDGLWDNVFADNIVQVVVQQEQLHQQQVEQQQQQQQQEQQKEGGGDGKSDSASDETSVVSDSGGGGGGGGGSVCSGSKRAERIAEKLGDVAVKVANNERSSSPFAVNARNAGHLFTGGKVDDITIISALVVDTSVALAPPTVRTQSSGAAE